MVFASNISRYSKELGSVGNETGVGKNQKRNEAKEREIGDASVHILLSAQLGRGCVGVCGGWLGPILREYQRLRETNRRKCGKMQ